MSSDVLGGRRSRVLRGAAAAAVRGAVLDADLSILHPGADRTHSGEAEDVARETREAAARVGYEDGYQAGRLQAAAEGEAATTAARSALAQSLQALEQAVTDVAGRQAAEVADVERHIVELGIAVAAAVLERELAVATTPARDALLRALRLAPERGDVTARLHPDDVDTVDVTAVIADRNVTVIADAAVEPGGCIVDVGACRIDAQVGPALERVRKALLS